MYFKGFKIVGFRGIGEETISITLDSKCTVLVGRNNSGKSTIMRALFWALQSDLLRRGHTQSYRTMKPSDRHQAANRDFEFTLNFDYDDEQEVERELRGIFPEGPWFTIQWGISEPKFTASCFGELDSLEAANSALATRGGGTLAGVDQIRPNDHLLAPQNYEAWCRSALPEVYLIPEFRQIRKQEGHDPRGHVLDGQDMERMLKRLKHPAVGEDSDLQLFHKIQHFVASLLDVPELELDVSHEDVLVVQEPGKPRLELSSFGTGVHQIVLITIAITAIQDSLICIEEPEVHLHPQLQRKFFEFLSRETTNRYLISTHSNAFIDRVGREASAYYVKNENGCVVASPALGNPDLLEALSDLGLRPSELLQANGIVWVEGPSDRIYQ